MRISLHQTPVAAIIPVQSPVASMNMELRKATVILANDQKTQGTKCSSSPNSSSAKSLKNMREEGVR